MPAGFLTLARENGARTPAEGSRAGSLPTGGSIHCGGPAGAFVEVPEEECITGMRGGRRECRGPSARQHGGTDATRLPPPPTAGRRAGPAAGRSQGLTRGSAPYSVYWNPFASELGFYVNLSEAVISLRTGSASGRSIPVSPTPPSNAWLSKVELAECWPSNGGRKTERGETVKEDPGFGPRRLAGRVSRAVGAAAEERALRLQWVRTCRVERCPGCPWTGASGRADQAPSLALHMGKGGTHCPLFPPKAVLGPGAS